VIHRAVPDFWNAYRQLPSDVQQLADKAFAQLKADPKHPGLHLKKVSGFWSVRIGLHHRAIAVEGDEAMVWFWIGTHAEYDRLIR
jgi:hypothetical protein